jgi:hypothetical protein
MLLPTADGARAITDAVRETYELVNSGRAMSGLPALAPKDGAKFHFELPGSVQGFAVEKGPQSAGVAKIENVLGHSKRGQRSLRVCFHQVAPGRAARVATPTFVWPELIAGQHYSVYASPTLYPGQVVRAAIEACPENKMAVSCRLYHRAYNAKDELVRVYGPQVELGAGERKELSWRIGSTDGAPIQEIGFELSSETRADGRVFLDYLTWDGAPDVTLVPPQNTSKTWLAAWVNAASNFYSGSAFEVVQNRGCGMVMQGSGSWTDYQVSATVTPHMAAAAGIAARVQGLNRYYALLIGHDGKLRLVKARNTISVLGETESAWVADKGYPLTLRVSGGHLTAMVGDKVVLEADDRSHPLTGGGVALVVEEGRVFFGPVTIAPTAGRG